MLLQAAAFPVKAYSYGDIHSAFNAIKAQWKDSDIRVGVFNAGAGVWKGFLDITEEDVKNTVDVNVLAGFAFARECIVAFKDLPYVSKIVYQSLADRAQTRQGAEERHTYIYRRHRIDQRK